MPAFGASAAAGLVADLFEPLDRRFARLEDAEVALARLLGDHLGEPRADRDDPAGKHRHADAVVAPLLEVLAGDARAQVEEPRRQVRRVEQRIVLRAEAQASTSASSRRQT